MSCGGAGKLATMSKRTSHSTEPRAERSVGTDDRVRPRLIAAAARCFLRDGFTPTTAEEIAAEGGVSRATFYRRFPSKDAVFAELVSQEAEPFIRGARALLTARGAFARRVENAFVYGVTEMPKNPVLRILFELGASPDNAVLFAAPFAAVVRGAMRPVLGPALEAGEIRPRLDLDEAADWMLRELLGLVAEGPWDEDRLRARIRTFVAPVLVPDDRRREDQRGGRRRAVSIDDRLEHLERRVVESRALLDVIAQDVARLVRQNP